jgi:hypothetical protein
MVSWRESDWGWKKDYWRDWYSEYWKEKYLVSG